MRHQEQEGNTNFTNIIKVFCNIMNIQYAECGAFPVLSNNSTSYISKTEFMMNVYAKLGQLEILSSYITEVTVGDVLTIEALVTNPLDWRSEEHTSELQSRFDL